MSLARENMPFADEVIFIQGIGPLPIVSVSAIYDVRHGQSRPWGVVTPLKA